MTHLAMQLAIVSCSYCRSALESEHPDNSAIRPMALKLYRSGALWMLSGFSDGQHTRHIESVVQQVVRSYT